MGKEKVVKEGEEGKAAPATRVVTEEAYAALAEQAQRAQEYWDRLLRLQAEFENTRKRLTKEQREFEQRAGERLLKELLGVVDDFERALSAAAADPEPAHLKVGIEMIYRRLLDLLKAHGVEAIEAAGRPFDPVRHEAVAHVVTADQPEATVVEELRRGYTLHGRVIRPATVKVAKGGSSSDGTRNRH